MQCIDTHVHFNLFEDTVDLASLVGIVPSTTSEKWHDVRLLTSHYPNIYPAFGLHPWFSHSQADIDVLDHIAPTGIAIGECGLDKQLSNIALSAQLEIFHPQLAIAQKHDLPVILHCVKAGDELAHVLKHYPNLRGVVHGFSGSVEQAKRFIDLGFYIGISHIAANPNATRLHALLKALPTNRLLLETDAPNKTFTHIENYRQDFAHMVTHIANNLNVKASELITNSNDNARKLFGI